MGDIFDIKNLFGGTKTKKTQARTLGDEIRSVLDLGPDVLASQQELSPGANRLELQNIYDLLLGTDGKAGTLGLYTNTVLPALTDAQNTAVSSTRSSFLDDLGSMGGSATEGIRSLNPSQSRLYDLLATDAEAGLKAGDRLTREETYNTVNPIRSDWASRGLGASAPAQLDEAVNLLTAGRGVGQQRRANAAGVAELGNRYYTQPALNILGAASAPTNQAQSFVAGTQQEAEPFNMLSQLGGYSQGLYGQNYSGALNTNLQNSQNATQLWSGLFGMFCWSAREVFGAADPRWKQFRDWMLLRAPVKFRTWYCIHGERWAQRLAAHPRHKAIVRRWMERKIQTLTLKPEATWP